MKRWAWNTTADYLGASKSFIIRIPLPTFIVKEIIKIKSVEIRPLFDEIRITCDLAPNKNMDIRYNQNGSSCGKDAW